MVAAPLQKSREYKTFVAFIDHSCLFEFSAACFGFFLIYLKRVRAMNSIMFCNHFCFPFTSIFLPVYNSEATGIYDLRIPNWCGELWPTGMANSIAAAKLKTVFSINQAVSPIEMSTHCKF